MTAWRYHLGVHKTATTHIQEVLKRQRAELLAKGINYVPLDELRPSTAPLLHSYIFPRTRFLRAVARDADSAILSEENWLGYPTEACAFPIYRNLEKRLKIVSNPDATAFLAVRDPADFAASVYSEAMRINPDKVSLASTRHAFLKNRSPWLDLVIRVRRFFPRLYVWRYEDYRDNAPYYISLVAGTSVSVPEIPDPQLTRRLPAETIGTLERLRAEGKNVPKANQIAPPANPTRFEMFSKDERESLTEAYERDIEALSKNGVLIGPGTRRSSFGG